eukprot:2229646-Prymnesium_polylepis.1
MPLDKLDDDLVAELPFERFPLYVGRADKRREVAVLKVRSAPTLAAKALSGETRWRKGPSPPNPNPADVRGVTGGGTGHGAR